MEELDENCSICCFTYNKVTKRQIICPKCLAKTCVACIKKYLLHSLHDPHCMHCQQTWDIQFTNTQLPWNYMSKEWRTSRKELLFHREQALLPETMPLVAIQMEKENLQKEFQDLQVEERKIKMRKRQIEDRLRQLELDGNTPTAPGQEEGSRESFFSIRACQTPECKGFVDGSKGYCLICHHHTCLQCNVVKLDPEQHECLSEDVQNWAAIAKLSKPCPQCATRIQKNSGCDQMWCPHCKSAWSWKTGAIVKGPIHNPHYYEYTARLGITGHGHEVEGDRGAENCGMVERLVWNFNYVLYHNNGHSRRIANKIQMDQFQRWHRLMNHHVHNTLPTIRFRAQQNNSDLRIRFLRNQISEEVFKKCLFQREIQRQKNQHLIEVYEMMQIISVHILRQFVQGIIKIDELFQQAQNMNNFANETISQINKTFHSKLAPLRLFYA